MKLLPALTTRHLSARICSEVYTACVLSAMPHGSETWGPNYHELQIVPWSARSVVSKTETKHPQLHYYTNLALRMLRRPFAVGDSDGMAIQWFKSCINSITNFPFTGIKNKEGLGRHGLNMWRLVSMSLTCVALTHKTEMHGEPVFDVGWDTDSTFLKWIWMVGAGKTPGPRLNIKDRLSRYGDSHVKDKTAGRTSYL